MALPSFDPDKHHVGIGPVGGTLDGFLLTGSYRRDPQRYGGSVEFGGGDDQIGATTLSRWSQSDFSGGAGQANFGSDEAMFYDCKNMLPSLVEKTARTCPPLEFFSGAGRIDAPDALGIFATGNRKVAVVDSDQIRFVNAETGSKLTVTDPDWEIQAAAHDPADNATYIVKKKPSDSTFSVNRIAPSDGSNTTIKLFPGAAKGPARGMVVTAGRDILVQMGPSLWLVDVNDDRDDGTITRIGRLPGQWQDAVTYAGVSYILLTDGEQQTLLVSWDGTQILPVTDFPYNFLGASLCVYGGRLYVGGTAQDITDNDKYAELYEVTGSSLRLIKSYGDESRAGFGPPKRFYDLAVHEGLLFAGTDKGQLFVYDLTRDAIWPNIEIVEAGGHAATLQARFLLSTRQKLVAWCYDGSGNAKDGFYRLATANTDLSGNYESFVETSDFMPEPDREKRWSALRVVSRYSPVPTLEYSTDGGSTWTALAATGSEGGPLYTTDFNLSGVPVSKAIRYRFTFTKSGVAYSELVAFTTTFAMFDSEKTGWAFTILGVVGAETADGSGDASIDIAALRTVLWGYWSDRTTLTFRDLGGDDHTVYLSDLNELLPQIGPPVDGDGTREAFFSVALTEV